MVSDWFWMIYGIAENPRPTGKCVKYTLAAWELSEQGLTTIRSTTSVRSEDIIYTEIWANVGI